MHDNSNSDFGDRSKIICATKYALVLTAMHTPKLIFYNYRPTTSDKAA
jgi:hypothetical protein